MFTGLPSSCTKNKYSTSQNIHSSDFIPSELSADCKKFLTASYSTQTWRKNFSAMNCLRKFGITQNIKVSLPLNSQTVTKFTEWCKTVKNLTPTTINAYLSAIALAHKFHGLDHTGCSNFVTKQMLKGMENLNFYNKNCKKTRKVMTLPLLKLAGSEISRLDWNVESKQALWAVLTTAFFGSFRLGEILSKNEKCFNPLEDLLWEDLTFRDDNSILIRIKVPKNKKLEGELIDLFPFKGHKCCPVAALKKLTLFDTC